MITGRYGGASMAIPVILLAVCFPQIVVMALIFGVVALVGVAIVSWL